MPGETPHSKVLHRRRVVRRTARVASSAGVDPKRCSARASRHQDASGTLHATTAQVTGKIEVVRERAHEKAHEEVSVHGHEMERGNIFRLIGLVAFFALMALVMVLIWPYLKDVVEPGGVSRLADEIKQSGAVGVLIVLGLQFLQIVVAFIPGEAVQMAAGMIYGPWLGALVIFVGGVLSSAFVFELVHRLGAPFVQAMVPTKYLSKFRRFEDTGKLNIIVFVLFLIPGLPKDVFTYLVPLTNMSMKTFLVLSNIGRIPGIVISTYAADGLVDGRIWQSVVIFAVLAIIGLVGLVYRDRMMRFFERHSKSHSKGRSEEGPKGKRK